MIYLEPDFAKTRGQVLTELIENDMLDHWPRFARVHENRELYHGTAAAMMPLPWTGASNIHLPILMEKVETLVPMLMSAFWGVEPVVNVERSPDEFMAEQTQDVEQYMNFVVRKDIPDMYETMEGWLRDMGCDGMAHVWPYWERTTRMVTEVHRLKRMYGANEPTAGGSPAPQAREKTVTELLVDIYGAPDVQNGLMQVTPTSEMSEEEQAVAEMTVVGTSWVIQFIEDRIIHTAYVEFRQARTIDEVEAVIRRRTIDREGVTLKGLEYDHVVLPFRAKCIQSADRVTVRYWLTVDEVEEKWQRGELELTEADMAVLRGSADRQDESQHFDPGLSRQKDHHTGSRNVTHSERVAQMPEQYQAYNKNKVQFFCVFLKDAPEPGAERCEVIYHIAHPLRKIVSAHYLDEQYPHGRRPIISAKYIPVANRAYGLGLGDQLAAINLECNTIINFINNGQQLVTNPIGFFEPSAMRTDSKGTQEVKPGEWIEVMNVKGIHIPQFPQAPERNMEVMTSLLMFGDRLTISPMNAGSTQMKNAPRTARGTMALLGEAHVKVDSLITRLQLGPWTEMMEQIFALHQTFAPDERWYYVTRQTERVPLRMSRKMMRGRYEFNFKGTVANTNKAVLQQQAQVRYATLMADPDVATDPNSRDQIRRDFLKYWGDGADPERLLPVLPGQGGYQHPPMRQQDENQVLALGVTVDVLFEDDDAVHLQVMDQFERTPAFEQFPAHAVGVYGAHKAKHQQQLQQKMAAQRLNVGGSQANNIPQGVSLNDDGGVGDTNVMEGGNVR